MCVPLCQQKITQHLSRRSFFKLSGLASVAAVASGCAPAAAPTVVPTPNGQFSFSRVVDLTHTLTPDFPTYFGQPQLEITPTMTLADNGVNIKQWTVLEHTGTHLDAPFHVSDQQTAEQIPVENLVGPLAVVNISAKAEGNPDAQVTLDDLKAWESANGPLPTDGIVAMYSGWDAHVSTAKFRNADDKQVMHFPGFHLEAVEFLMAERKIKGLMVDTLSLDYGPSADFAVHFRWLPTNRWGLECAASLGQLPVKGAYVVVGGPKIAGATGGPSRVIALV